MNQQTFDSIYRDLYALATAENRGLYCANKCRPGVYSGDWQSLLDQFCRGRLSAVDAIQVIKAGFVPSYMLDSGRIEYLFNRSKTK